MQMRREMQLRCITGSPLLHLTTENSFNTLRPRQNGRHFADDIFMRIFVNENVWIPIEISLKFVPKGPINNIPALVQKMAWRRPGDRPLSEPMMVNLQYMKLKAIGAVSTPDLVCVKCVHKIVAQIMAWCRPGDNPLHIPMVSDVIYTSGNSHGITRTDKHILSIQTTNQFRYLDEDNCVGNFMQILSLLLLMLMYDWIWTRLLWMHRP